MSTFYERLEQIARRFDEIEGELAHPSGAFDQTRYTALVKERAAIEETVGVYRLYEKTLEEFASNEVLLKDGGDAELHALAEEEAKSLRARRKDLEERLTLLMIPKDPDDDKDVFIEIRAGAGGDEAAIFAGDLARMYIRYAEIQKMRVEILSMNESDAGGFKEIVFTAGGNDAYRHFKHESGVHRVQRVPVTESQGRVHTSTATVAVLPQVDEEIEIDIRPGDLQIDTYKASGAGGQHVNKTESAIRITHLPSGVVVSCSEERSQMQNREKAMAMLRSVLHARKKREAEEAVGSMRRSQVGTGDRSEKIRTYNFPQDRITDHRINQSFGNIRAALDGEISHIVEELLKDERARLLAGASNSPV